MCALYKKPVLCILLIACLLFIGCADENDHNHEYEPSGDDDQSGDDDDAPPPSLEFDPTQMGPFPVGNLTREFRDGSRWDITTQSERRLLVEIWYPAVQTGDEVPVQGIPHFLNGWDEFVIGLLSFLITPEEVDNFEIQTLFAKRGIEPDRSGAPYPVIFFSHGNFGIRFQNWHMCEYLASHGYVVVSVDHTGNAVFVTFEDRIIVGNPLLMPTSHFARRDDISFLLDQMEELTVYDHEGWLTGLVDPTRAGMVGHSFGAATTGAVLRNDDRFLAGVLCNGPAMIWYEDDYHAAVLHMYGDEDRTMRDTVFFMDWGYDTAPPPKYRLDAFDGGHYTFTDACLLMPSLMGEGDGCGLGRRFSNDEEFEYLPQDKAQAILSSYTTAMMGFYLSGFESHRDFLLENHFPDEMRYTYTLE